MHLQITSYGLSDVFNCGLLKVRVSISQEAHEMIFASCRGLHGVNQSSQTRTLLLPDQGEEFAPKYSNVGLLKKTMPTMLHK